MPRSREEFYQSILINLSLILAIDFAEYRINPIQPEIPLAVIYDAAS